MGANKSGIYTRALANFSGVDFSSDDSNVEDYRMPYAVNMWRDYESENGAAVETIPGYRKLQYDYRTNDGYSVPEAPITQIWKAKLKDTSGSLQTCLLVHRGTYLHVAQYGAPNSHGYALAIADIGTAKACGFTYGDCFYILGSGHMWKISDQSTAKEIVDKTVSEDSAVQIEAYVPITYADGEEYEQRNMLTNYFFHTYNVNRSSSDIHNNGLVVEPIENSTKELAVTGVMPGLTRIYIPDTMEYNGDIYKITEIRADAFAGNTKLKSVVAGKSIRRVGADAINGGDSTGHKRGSFYYCSNLEFVMLHGVSTLGEETFAGASSLKSVVLPNTLASVGEGLFYQTNSELKVYYGGEGTSTVYQELVSELGSSDKIKTDTIIVSTQVGEYIRIPCDHYWQAAVSEDNTPEAIRLIGRYSDDTGSAEGETTANTSGVQFLAEEKTSWCRLYVYIDRYEPTNIFVSVSDDEGTLSTRETTEGSYYFSIFDPCLSIDNVYVGTTQINANPLFFPNYVMKTEIRNGKTYITSVVINISSEKIINEKVKILGKAYESEFSISSAGSDYTYDNAAYTGTSSEAIKKCTIVAEFDGRIFLSGNKDLPNTVFYSNRNLSGANDPTYFGQLNYFNDGAGLSVNACLLSTPSFLAVIKEDDGDGAIYFHTAEATSFNVLPKIYPGTKGSGGTGCVGPCINFRDDPVFISKMGLEGISLAAVNSERGVYHRSSNVDRLLLTEDLSEAVLCEWKGYLVILLKGKIYLADSRKIFDSSIGSKQYEWFYLDDIGEYKGQTECYFYLSASPYDSAGNKYTDMYHPSDGIRFEIKEEEAIFTGTVKSTYPSLNPDGSGATGNAYVCYSEEYDQYDNKHYYILDKSGEMTGGTFSPACSACVVADTLIFGCESGNLFVFNTDKRGQAYSWSSSSSGTVTEQVSSDRIHRYWYTFNNRRYLSGFSTKKDNCNVPHYDKDTVVRSLVIKSKTITGSKFDLYVRTDREDWESVSFGTGTENTNFDTDFSNASFITSGENITLSREKKRRWVEKQFYLKSDCYMQPFGIYSIVYRYKLSGIAGRIRRG